MDDTNPTEEQVISIENRVNKELALTAFGIKKHESKVLAYLSEGKTANTRELEIQLGLRQPEVSISVKILKEKGWLQERDEKTPGKGRPGKVYKLRLSFRTIVKRLEADMIKNQEEQRQQILNLLKSSNQEGQKKIIEEA